MNATRLLKALAAAGLLGLGVAPIASAQSLPVDVDITIDPAGTTIFNYFASLDVILDPTDLATLQNASYCAASATVSQCAIPAGPSGQASVGAGAGGGDLNADAGIVIAAAGNDLSAVKLDIDNVWAVRSTGGVSANTTVSILIGSDTVLNNADGVSTITISSPKVYMMQGGGAPDTSKSFSDPGLTTPEFGGVQLILDLTNATGVGEYSTATDTGDQNYLIGVTGT